MLNRSRQFWGSIHSGTNERWNDCGSLPKEIHLSV